MEHAVPSGAPGLATGVFLVGASRTVPCASGGRPGATQASPRGAVVRLWGDGFLRGEWSRAWNTPSPPGHRGFANGRVPRGRFAHRAGVPPAGVQAPRRLRLVARWSDCGGRVPPWRLRPPGDGHGETSMTIVGWHASHEQIAAEPAARRRPPRRGRPASTRRCRRITSRRGANGRASPGSRGRGWARRWRRRRCRSASSTLRASATTRRSSPRPRRRSPRCSRDRLWVALGTGEYSNEHITGAAVAGQGDAQPPARGVRRGDARAVRRRGGDHHGLVVVDRARLWTLPATPPALLARGGVAGDGRLGRRLGRRPDHGGPGPPAVLRAVVERVPRRRRATASRCTSRSTCRGRRPTTRRSAIAFDQWRTNVFDPPLCWDLARVEHFDEAARHVAPEDVAARVIVSSDPRRHLARLAELVDDRVRRDLAPPRRHASRSAFIDVFGEHVVAAAAPRHAVTRRRRRRVRSDGDGYGWRMPERWYPPRRRLLPRRRHVPGLRRRRHRRPRRADRPPRLPRPARASRASGSTRSTRAPTATTATTSPTSTPSTRGSARSATSSSSSTRPATGASG